MVDPEQLGQPRRTGRRGVPRGGRDLTRQQPSRQRLGRGPVTPVEADLVVSGRVEPDHPGGRRTVRGADVDHGQAGPRQRYGGGRAVDHEQQVAGSGKQVVEARSGSAHQPHRPGGIGPLRALGVRQPLDPLPLVERVVGRDHHHRQLGGGVEGRAGADERAGQSAGRVRPADERDPVVLAEVERDRQVGLRAMGREQAPYGGHGGRVGIVRVQVGWCLERDAERLGSNAVPDLQEGRVVRAPLPDPGAIGGDHGQRRRRGVRPMSSPTLARRGIAYGGPHPRQVPQVAASGAGQLASALSALPVELDAEVGDRRHQEQPGRDDPHLRAAVAERGHQYHRAQAPEHRDRADGDSAGSLGGGQTRRLLEPDPARGQLGT